MQRKGFCSFFIFLFFSLALFGEEGDFPIPLNNQEKELVRELISSMGNKNDLQLLFKKRHLEKIGDRIRHIPPLVFLGFILSEEPLKSCLKKIKRSPFKWRPFVKGFGDNMEKEMRANRLFCDLKTFASFAKVSSSQLELFARRSEWEAFIKYVLKK